MQPTDEMNGNLACHYNKSKPNKQNQQHNSNKKTFISLTDPNLFNALENYPSEEIYY